MTERSPINALDLTFLDPEVIQCPYPAYDRLLAEAPVYHDPGTGFYVVTRYDDVRSILLDPETFSSEGYIKQVREGVQGERAARMRRLYEEKGWLPSFALGFIDDPRHKEVRKIFEKAFRAGKIKEIDPFIRDTAYRLVEELADAEGCDIIQKLGAPLPQLITAYQTGVPLGQFDKIQVWIEAFIRRFGLMITEEEERECVLMEIEAQHYLMGIIERLREEPDQTILSDLVNTRMSDGSMLSDNELLTHLMADIFVGGSETTTSALASGVRLLAENPHLCERLVQDPENAIKPFVEEVLRLESPVQGLFRVTTKAVELSGVEIPKEAILNIRYAAANRDPHQFSCPAELDPARKNAGSHLAFGSGIHHCIGAPLARRELYWGFRAVLEALDDLRLNSNESDFGYNPNFMLRSLCRLHISYRRRV